MLELLFPRTAPTASLETASRAACREHDRHIARTGQYHLFRLPVADEDAIHDWLQRPAADDALRRLAGLSHEERLTELTTLAGSESALDARGPVSCGSIESRHRTGTIQKICAAYLGGFRAGRPIYPYLEELRT